jgi:phosphoribosylaminoimidazole-succinocarboxamide synthase
MGSVKDLKVIKSAQAEAPGIGHFHFSDRYSVFDWGEMPDLITNKGKALCMMSAYFFEKLEETGISTHYRGLVEGGTVKHLTDLSTPLDTMEVSLVRVLSPTTGTGNYDYSIYNSELTNLLIPLEIIYRNSLPAGSSVFRRLEDGSLSVDEIGLTHLPQPNDVLEKPILDVSTKLEITDRYLSWKEAQEISALTDEELKKLKETTYKINTLITEHASRAGLVNEDGKVEFAFDEQRRLMLVDVLGTPDECRFTHNNIPVSKEVARIHYRKSDWYQAVEHAKNEDRAHWKDRVTTPPPKLPARLFELVSYLYQSSCNEITRKQWFPAPPLSDILKELKEHLDA